MPSPCMPSRRVVSYISTLSAMFPDCASGQVGQLANWPTRLPCSPVPFSGLRGYRHGIEPLCVALVAPAQRGLEDLLQFPRDLAGRAERVIVYLAHGDELGRGAGQEQLVGQVQLRAGDVALHDLDALVAG